jgi:thiol:disulfide interchange protein DsbD
MKKKSAYTHYNNFKRHLLIAMLFFCCLTLSNCGKNKSESNNEAVNPFGSEVSKGKSQILRPCHWTYTVEQSSPDEAILISTAKLDSGWHLYSQHIPNKGPRMEFAYDSLINYKLVGITEEGKSIKKYDPNLEMEVLYFENEAIFRQKVKVMSTNDFVINGTIDYMVCLDDFQCVKSDEEFSFNVKGNPQAK